MPSPSRDRWATRGAFVLAAVGSAVGLGNIWRYPHVAYNAGGGAFLIPYFIALLTAGIPLLMLEFGLGHRMQSAAPASFARIHRKLEFAGWWATIGGLFITFYYTVIMAWICFYVVDLTGGLFTGAMPWKEGMAGAYLDSRVLTGNAQTTAEAWSFWPLNFLAILFNGLVWIAIYYSIRNGVHSVGKVVWFSVLFPYVLLLILFFTVIRLDGASAGLSYYLSPDWSKFTDPETGNISFHAIAKVASAAYGQIFFSLSIGFGIMIAYASFLPKKADLINNARITAYANSATEFFAGFITFAVLGFLAVTHGKFVGDVVGTSSFTLALVSYPTAIETMTDWGVTGQCLFGITFFVCLLILGVDSAFTLLDALVAGICDKFSVSRKRVTAIFCLVGWLVGICFCTPTGIVLLDAADHFLADYGLLMVGLAQCIAVGWLMNPASLRSHMNSVSEVRTTMFWDFCVKYFTPVVLVFLLAFQLYSDIVEGNRSSAVNILGFCILFTAFAAAIVLSKVRPQKLGYLDAPEVEHEQK